MMKLLKSGKTFKVNVLGPSLVAEIKIPTARAISKLKLYRIYYIHHAIWFRWFRCTIITYKSTTHSIDFKKIHIILHQKITMLLYK